MALLLDSRRWHSNQYVNDGSIFVFGSNLAGRHGAGAAKFAMRLGAEYGNGIGIQGLTYAIPTKNENLEVLDVTSIGTHVKDFIEYARSNPSTSFFVTRIGCGLAGYRDSEIAPMFNDSPVNCIFSKDWYPYLEFNETCLDCISKDLE